MQQQASWMRTFNLQICLLVKLHITPLSIFKAKHQDSRCPFAVSKKERQHMLYELFNALFHRFNNKFRNIYNWITMNQMAMITKKTKKTKIMFLTKKHTMPNVRYKQTVLFYPHDLKKAGFLFLQIEVVSDYNLLGIMLDESLLFSSYV